MGTAVVVPAAGRGERLGAGPPKALREVRGEALLVHAVRALCAAPSVTSVVVVAPADEAAAARELLSPLVRERLRAVLDVVDGGPTRQASVARGLAAVPPDADVVLVHDAARAFVPADLVERVVAAVRGGAPAVVPGVRVADTVRMVGADGRAVGTLDRDSLRAVQTPQGFARGVLDAAHRAAESSGDVADATDDAALVERIGTALLVVEGSPDAFKVTTPFDLLLAEALLVVRAGAP